VLLLPLAALGAVKTAMRLPALAVLGAALWYMTGPEGGLYRAAMLIPGLHQVRAPIQGWFIAALALAMLAAAGTDWAGARLPVPWLRLALAAVLFADLWYWNSLHNPLAYARMSFDEMYGAHEEMGREKVAATQPLLTRFDAPRNFAAMGPLDHPLDLKLESTYGYFALEPALYDEYDEARKRNPKLGDGLNLGRYVNMQTGAVDMNPSALPRAYFPKTVGDVRNEAESKSALETLDPGARSIALTPHAPFQQDAAATARVVYHDERSYRVKYAAAAPSLLKLSEDWHPGWRASMGATDLPVVRVDHALMGAVVPAGTGEVTFRFHSTYFAIGAAITLAAIVGLGAAAIYWNGE
jgi:hypothetical protein